MLTLGKVCCIFSKGISFQLATRVAKQLFWQQMRVALLFYIKTSEIAVYGTVRLSMAEPDSCPPSKNQIGRLLSNRTKYKLLASQSLYALMWPFPIRKVQEKGRGNNAS